MRKSTTIYLLVLALTLIAGNTMATVPPQPEGPPLQYQLSQVTISVLHQTGHGLPGGYEITVNGDGKGVYLEKNGDKPVKSTMQISTEQLMELVNSFYQAHFFELADSYSVKMQVMLRDDGSVATLGTKLVDMGGTKACIQLADYKKCVTIVDNQPGAAVQIVGAIKGLFAK